MEAAVSFTHTSTTACVPVTGLHARGWASEDQSAPAPALKTWEEEKNMGRPTARQSVVMRRGKHWAARFTGAVGARGGPGTQGRTFPGRPTF